MPIVAVLEKDPGAASTSDNSNPPTDSVDMASLAGLYWIGNMVPVAHSAERQIVALEVAGSNPVGHPTT